MLPARYGLSFTVFLPDLQEENNTLCISLEASQTKLRRTQTPLELRALIKQDVDDFVKTEDPQSVNRVQSIRRLIKRWQTGKNGICTAMPSHQAVSISACDECDICCVCCLHMLKLCTCLAMLCTA